VAADFHRVLCASWHQWYGDTVTAQMLTVWNLQVWKHQVPFGAVARLHGLNPLAAALHLWLELSLLPATWLCDIIARGMCSVICEGESEKQCESDGMLWGRLCTRGRRKG
jgi:hypothetical protein